ncbi:MAG: discoidin domain-containing protein [Bacteroidaceae bacterium]|nr:discoidin domain-containing protein [Bacteroidaceae bacterium]
MKRLLSFPLLLLAVIAFAGNNVLPYWAIGGFVRPEGKNPMVSPIADNLFYCPMKKANVRWECADTFNPAAVEKDGKVCVLYRAEDDPDAGIGKRTSRIGLVESADGISIDYRSPSPVMFPNQSSISQEFEWPGGTEDPRVVEAQVDGAPLYVMTYTSWNRKTARLSVATSRDLKTWTHHGPCFRTAYDAKFANLACKSGSIVTEIKDGRLQAAKVQVNGESKYFMYWGEYWVCGATSDDLITWTPIVDSDTELLYLAKPRKGFFDSMLTECGPPAVMTEDGIVLIYNGKNASGSNGDACYAANTYAAGQMLFSKDNPLQLVDRLDKPFFRPVADFEKSGQYAAGTVFTEGLVWHQDKWFLYYGCADSFVGVAVCDPQTSPHEGDPIITAQVPEGVINQQTAPGTGKMTCFVSSASGYAAEGERPYYMNTSYIYPGRKWCDTSTEQPWLILEFTGIYEVNRFVFRDVEGRESNCGNVPEYWVYGRTKTGEEWTLLAHEDNVGDKAEKDVSFPATEVRYMKLVFSRGTRPSGEKDNAIRLYGCDVYGRFVSELPRSDDNVSIGKSILAAHDAPDATKSALNLLTGVPSAERPWRPTTPQQGSDPYRYVIVDLEQTYDIKRLLLWDAKSIDTDATNMNAYQMFISQEEPDLSLITKTDDSNTCWTQVADKKNVGSINKKTVTLSTPVRGRYVKLVFPRTSASMNNAEVPALYAFHVYGTLVEDEDAIAAPHIYKQDDASVFSLSGIKQERQSLKPGLYIKSGRVVLVHD